MDGSRLENTGVRRANLAGFLLALFGMTALAGQAADSPAATQVAADDDPFLWLEDVEGARAMQWVRAENQKTLTRLQKDARYPKLYADAVSLAEDKDRIPMPSFVHGQVYNFWQDAGHVRGLWRTTTVDSFRAAEPSWSTVLDLDALSAAQKANWVWEDADCLMPSEQRCLLSLSDGGEDATSLREFNLETRAFVPQGFELPKSKQTEGWLGENQVLVSREWGPGTMTASGYPFVVKTLTRDAKLNEAREVFRGKQDDVGVMIAALPDSANNHAVFIERLVTFFQIEHYLMSPKGPVRLNVPLKSVLQAVINGQLLLSVNEPWVVGGQSIPQGSLVALDLKRVVLDAEHLLPHLVYSPGPRETLSEAAATHSQLIVTRYDNVRGRAAVYTPTAHGAWNQRSLDLPDNSAIAIVTADSHSDQAYLRVTSFLTPTTLWQVDTAKAHATQIKALPAKFDTSQLVVEQHEAKSKDGTLIPYFLVHRRGMSPDGQNPTILNAYGGFQVSKTPRYSAELGKLWLERGGAYVLANIRGGGEFGPAWHEAGLKTHRQRIYDDFAAVAQDLIATHITSPRRLGIEGGSNGGLLMGVEFTQHPELWNAVDIQVPLLDMLRYEKIAAGASWVGEYGSVSVPEERAFLSSISPYNNLKPNVHYPEPLVWTTTKDDRVGPQHARKFAAKLAAMGVPYLYYEVIEGGHAAGANLKEKALTTALEMTYFTEKLMN